jgi:hypothetical protein
VPQRNKKEIVMKKLIIGMAAFLCVSGIASAKDFYVVDAKIYDQDTLIDSPMMGVEVNKEASVSVDNRYNLTLLIKEKSEKTVVVSINLKLKNKEINPMFEVELGKDASISVGETKLSILVTKSSI